ncbi:ABC transporter substrate-binding protein [Prauserella cavernicola]|uniref:ABC transporter substrate-binding protein n=1 Tax=Prauserella cavernicola TaxID=2800127 RepID=A0A934QVF2_9PSEU|nr:ABC transporter substrate-binding protein [Prauserella cavernicola]MBK1787281.1 ABC transporter substrate-binding protein [Prauserella cavernicola]
MGTLATRRRTASRLAAAAAVSLIVVSCGAAPGSGDGQAREASDADIASLTVAVTAAPRSLDPAGSWDSNSIYVLAELLDPLAKIGPDGTVEPWLATSWETPDPRTYVFTIRDDVTFWDGSPLTAEDVAFSLGRHTDPDVASELAATFQYVDTVTETGPHEVTVTLTQPDPQFLYAVSAGGLVLQKKHAEASGDDLGGPQAMVMGSGPYRVVDYSSSTGATLERNDDYWGEAPAARTLEFTQIADPETRRLAMQSGDVDLTFSVPMDGVRQWETLPGVTVDFFDTPIIGYLVLDTSQEPFDDVHVRRALAHALDREAIVDSLFRGHARPAESMVDPLSWPTLAEKTGTDVERLYDELPTYEFDLDKARAELAKSDHADGFTITAKYPASLPMLGNIVQVLAANLEKIGITLTASEVQYQEFLGGIMNNGYLGLTPFQMGAESPDPGTALRGLLGAERAKPGSGGFNHAKYVPAELEDAVSANLTGTPEERADAIDTLMTALAEDVPYVPIYFAQYAVALSEDYVYTGELSYWSLFFTEWATAIKAAR